MTERPNLWAPGFSTFRAAARARLPGSLFWLVLGAGLVLRLRQYFFHRALWCDEAMLAMHLTHRTVAEMFRPLLDPLQIAPPAFLAATAVFARALPGPVEMRLRFFPFLCGIACFLLFAAFCRRRLDQYGAVLAVGLFALSAPFIYYTNEVKQYASDALCALLLLVLALPCVHQGLSTRRTLGLALAGSAAMWFSHPAIFVLASIAIVIGYPMVTSGRRADLVGYSVLIASWGICFVVFYFVAVRPNSGLKEVQDFHREAFLPVPPHGLADLRRCVQALFGMFIQPGGFSAPVLAFLLACWGVGWSKRFSRTEKWLLLLPLLCCAVASAAQRYPFTGRLLLFVAPVLLLFVAEGAVCCASLLSARRLAWLPAFLLLLQPAGNAVESFVHPTEIEEIRPVLAYLTAQTRPGDLVFLHHESRWNFAFYQAAYPLPGVDVQQAAWTAAADDYLPRLTALTGRPRVWVLFAHTTPEDVSRVLSYARQLGITSQHLETRGASVWLFDFTPAATPRASQPPVVP